MPQSVTPFEQFSKLFSSATAEVEIWGEEPSAERTADLRNSTGGPPAAPSDVIASDMKKENEEEEEEEEDDDEEEEEEDDVLREKLLKRLAEATSKLEQRSYEAGVAELKTLLVAVKEFQRNVHAIAQFDFEADSQ